MIYPPSHPAWLRFAAALFAWFLAIGATFGAEPSNDNFASARLLSGNSGVVTGTNLEATLQFESDEPDHGGDGAGQSVWYRWTAPSSALYSFSTEGSDFDTVLAIYTGSTFATLSEVDSAHGEIFYGVPARVYFRAVIGTTYRIAVDGWYADTNWEGAIRLSWAIVLPPANDNFANATVLSARNGTISVSNREGSKEPGEAGLLSDASVWYRYTAVESGYLTVLEDQTTTQIIPAISVYSGATLDSLVPIPLDTNRGAYRVVAGTTYSIMLEGELPGDVGDIVVDYSLTGENDYFTTPRLIAGASGTVSDDNTGATFESGESPHSSTAAGSSLWFRWVAPTSGRIWWSAEEARGAVQKTYLGAIAIYTGTAVNALTPVAVGSFSPITFDAVAGTEYQIAVDSSDIVNEGPFKLSWRQVLQPANDPLANASLLTGNIGQFSATLLGATREAAEVSEFQAFEPASAVSVWYRWTAPSSGIFVMNKNAAQASVSLAQVAGTGNAPFHPLATGAGSSLTIGVAAGQTVTLRVAGDSLFEPDATVTFHFYPGASTFYSETMPQLRERLAESGTFKVVRAAGDFTKSATVTLSPYVAAGVAVLGTDFTLPSGALSFAPGELSKTLTVTAVNNATNSGNKRLVLLLNAGTNALIFANGSEGLIIDDDDDPVNNLIANATPLSGQTGTLAGTTAGADRDFSDPGYDANTGVLRLAPTPTVWYRWTAPQTGAVKFTATPPPAKPVKIRIAAFDGQGANAAALNDSDSGTIGWLATAGQTYYIAVAIHEFDSTTDAILGGTSFSLAWKYLAGGIVTASSATVLEGPGATASVTLTRVGGTDAFQVRLDTASVGSAEVGADFDFTTQIIQFALGETTKTALVPILNDALIEEPETFAVKLSSTSSEVLAGKDGVITIQDEDGGAALSFSTTTATAAEDAGPVQLTIIRNGVPTGTATADFTIVAGSASSADVAVAGGAVIFADGELSKIIAIPLFDDTLDEPSETFTVMLTNPAPGTRIGPSPSAQITIIDDDIPGVLSLAATTFTAQENAATADLTITRTNGSDGTVSATFTATPGTATAGSDYATTSGTVTLLDGETTKTFCISLLDDFVDEPNETFAVTLSAPTAGASLGTLQTATVTIVDNDIPGTLAFSATAFPASEHDASAILTIARTGGSDGAVSVRYTATAGTATDGEDFAAVSGTVNFTHGETSRQLLIPLRGDGFVESPETFTVTLNTATAGATLGAQTTATVTIADDDSFTGKKAAYSAMLTSAGLGKGSVFLKTTTTGKLTAQVLLGSAKLSFSGTADVNGRAMLTFKKKGFPDQILSLRLGGAEFDGSLDDGLGNVFTFAGSENASGTKSTPVKSAAAYTALIQTRPALNGGLLAFGFPQGRGWLTIAVEPTAKTTLKGKLADGTPLSFSGTLDAFGELPVFIPLYAGKQGSIAFTLVFDSAQSQTDATAEAVLWVKPRSPKDKLYPFGWPGGITADLAGSKLIAPAKVTAKNPTPTYLLGTHNILGLAAPSSFTAAFAGTTNSLNIDAKNKTTATPSAANLAATVTTSGAFGGRFTHPANGKVVKFSGVILQKSHTAGGTFVAPDSTSAAVTLAPTP